MRKYIYIIYALCFFDGVQAQVLWSEDFDSYITGTFSMGQGGWTGGLTNSEIRVISEPGRGNVLAWGWITGNAIATQNDLRQYNLTNLWNTRTPGNNVLKLEYDLYTEDFPVAGLENIYTSGGVFYKTIKGSSGLPID